MPAPAVHLRQSTRRVRCIDHAAQFEMSHVNANRITGVHLTEREHVPGCPEALKALLATLLQLVRE